MTVAVMNRWTALRLRRRLKRPAPALQSVVYRLQAQLESAPRAALSVVEIEAAIPAAVSIAALAYHLASQGKTVVLADAAKGRPLRKLLRAKARPGTLENVVLHGQSLSLFVAPPDPARMAQAAEGAEGIGAAEGVERATVDADVTLVLATVDPAIGAAHLAPWATSAVAMVRAGGATKPRLEGVAAHLRHARIRLLSAILTGSDPFDQSSGFPAGWTSADDLAPGLLKILRASGE